MPDEGANPDVPTSPTAGASKEPSPTSPPPPPVPSADPNLVFQAQTPPPLHAAPTKGSEDLFKLAPVAALRLLSAGVEALVRVTGDIPPTPPPTSPTIPHMRGFQREKAAIVRSHSEKNLARLQEQAESAGVKAADNTDQQSFFDAAAVAAAIGSASQPATNSKHSSMAPTPVQPIDGVHLRPTPTPPPAPRSASPATPQPYIVVGENMQPLNLQHSAITRKFYSKAPPPISVEEYLLRMHRFCPMSTAVYLATSLYIHRLAVEERAIPVTKRNCHRLLLAGLRVAMKALEDLSYPHAKIARVGGVSEAELARLEISFCFLAGFELVVGEEALKKHMEMLKEGRMYGALEPGSGIPKLGHIPKLKLEHRRKTEIQTLTGG